MGIIQSGWRSKDKNKALRWIAKTAGVSISLRDAVLYASDREIQIAALERITDSELLRDIALSGLISDTELKTAAVRQITDQRILTDLARTRNKTAIETLTDQSVLYDIAVNHFFFEINPYIKQEESVKIGEMLAALAFQRLREPALKQKAADNTTYSSVAAAYVDSVTDLSELIKLAQDNRVNTRCRAFAIGKISDQSVLLALALGDGDSCVRRAAMRRVTDPEQRILFCEECGHEWEHIRSENKENGEFRYTDYFYRCKWCGKETCI
ncbi:MAG: hypothetical protein GX417_01025 [Clostridiales bacterium]|nr:hypothetical protein [Clostridiales bacterium]